MEGKLTTIMVVGFVLLFLTFVCGGFDPFAADAARQEAEMVEAIGEEQIAAMAIAKQKKIDSNKVRYPDFEGATQVPDGIWDCSMSSYKGSQYWTKSGEQAIFACDKFENAYMRAGEQVISKPSGFDDELINEFIPE